MAARSSGPGTGSGTPDNLINLGAYYQQHYRDTFHAALAADKVEPLVIPWSFIGSFFLPLVYLSIPHANRPWLYRMRWAVAAAVVYLNIRLVHTTSAGNEAVAYATGLVAGWGSISALRLLIFSRPQWDAARVECRPRTRDSAVEEKEVVMAAPDESVAAVIRDTEYFWQPFPANASFFTRICWTADLLTAFRGGGWNFCISSIPHPPSPKPPFKSADGPLPVRLDLIPRTSRTGAGRSLTYASFFRSRLLHFVLSYLTIDFLTIFIRHDPYFLLGPDYATHDPSLTLPRFLTALPWPTLTIPVVRNLAGLAGVISGLHMYSSVLQLALVFLVPRSLYGTRTELWQHPTLFGDAIVCVLDRGLAGFWGGWWHQTFRAGFVAPARWAFSVLYPHHHRHEATEQHQQHEVQEQHPYADHHQTTQHDDKKHHQRDHHHHPHHHRLPPKLKTLRSLTEFLLAFLLSGLLHAAGGFTSARRHIITTPHMTGTFTPVTFFLLQVPGILLQLSFSSLLRHHHHLLNTKFQPPRWLRRLANLAFVALWLHLTVWGLFDDMSRAGLWLFEPVPASPLRALGLGPRGEGWWRWDGEYGLRWYGGGGGRWWEGGVRL